MNEYLKEALEIDNGPDIEEVKSEDKESYQTNTTPDPSSASTDDVPNRTKDKITLSAETIYELASLSSSGKPNTNKVSYKAKTKAKNRKKMAKASKKRNR